MLEWVQRVSSVWCLKKKHRKGEIVWRSLNASGIERNYGGIRLYAP
jgi:hypothetical protein